MLEPREADVPALFLILIVLPLVAYFLLGKWSESAKKRERINLLARLAAEEARRAEAMAVADVIVPSPVALTKNAASMKSVPSTKNGFHTCARCYNPSTTRCAKCKSVRYCSGKCQIIHWREVHKQECQPREFAYSSSLPTVVSVEEPFSERFLPNDTMNSHYFGYNIDQTSGQKPASENVVFPSVSSGVSAAVDCSPVDMSQVSTAGRKSTEKRALRKSNKEVSRKKEFASSAVSGETAGVAHKSRKSESIVTEESTKKQNGNISDGYIHGRVPARSSTLRESDVNEDQNGNVFDSSENSQGFYPTRYVSNGLEVGMDYSTQNNEQAESRSSSDANSLKGIAKARRAPYSLGSKSCKLPKSTTKETSEQFSSEKEKKGQMAESKSSRTRVAPVQSSNGGSNSRIMKMMGLKKPTKLSRKMLFPYDEFMKFFQCEVYELSPRGLLNCGNSCYANAVLQCLTSTKPLTIYLLRRSHSSACCGKDWCLMCELEQHVIMLREIGGPLSPSRILLQMRSINCHIGDGSQEDAHEFLRLLVASMQAICLEGLGGENKVDTRLQETTFIQHTFGGYLRSKVKCLRCHHESERYENIMDLTLEIFGWVESLEDALTQFTTPEDLDGENMYRCGRCASYVRARKQLSIHEAPNILTIVLKRFQEGRYGKINKCITFPDMLDMIPFMTGTGDVPPLYLLYAVVVHLDTLNASFSGHYVSYVKDLQGNWYRIDDTEVQPVPMSQVMSEGAYILFYMRSYPRPQRPQVPESAHHFIPNPSRPGQTKHNTQHVGTEPLTADVRPEYSNGILRNANRNSIPVMETYAEPMSVEFSDATSSDWSIFTSSDDASFTTESTRDSFSTVDYSDASLLLDPISSIFNTRYTPEYPPGNGSSVCCRKFSGNSSQTRFFSQAKKGRVLDSLSGGGSPAMFSSDGSNCGGGVYVRYGSSNQNAMGLN